MKKVKDGIVFSNDIYRIMQGKNALDFDYAKNGLIIPTEEQIRKLRSDFKRDVNRIFDGKVTIFSETEMDDFLYDSLEDCWEYPIISLDKTYFRGENDSYFLDCTRLDGSDQLISRKNLNDIDSVKKQIKEISEKLKANNTFEIFLVDDVAFSGNVLKSIIHNFSQNNITVLGIRVAISTKESYEYFNRHLKNGLKCGCMLEKDVIDQICERDFYFGIAQSGISIVNPIGKILKAPYFKPYGNPVVRASIPTESEDFFSIGCIMRSMYLWHCIEENSKKLVYIKDLPESIISTRQEDRVVNSLRKELNYYEKVANRSYGECR